MGTARIAVHDDVPQLSALCRQAHDDLRPARGGDLFVVRHARAEPLEDGFAADVADGEHGVFVGEFDGVALGYAAVGREPLRDGTVLGVVTDLYVEPGGREVGIGEALMGAVLAWAKDRGCIGVDAPALPGERLTKNFFEANGFTARLLIMHRRL